MGHRSLRHALDRDVYQVVRKLADDQIAAGTPQKLSVQAVHESIRRSNSSLKRRPKATLEDSIERVLAVLVEDEGDDSDGSEDADDHVAPLPQVDNNVMNRSIRKAITPKIAPPKESPKMNGYSDANENSERPSKRKRASRETTLAPPTHIGWKDLGGMDSIIASLHESIVLPLKCPEMFVERGLKIPRGILLYGPPGTGKTMLAEATAAELKLPFLQIAAPSIVSGMSGESEKQLRQHFENAIRMAPCLMFIDEIDAICPKRESAQREMERRIVAQLLTCMDDLALEKTNGKPVIVLAATNRPDSLDPALRRGGRFDTEINIGVPSPAVRESILRAQTRNTRLADDVNFAQLAIMTPGYVGADLESLVYKAGSASIKRYMDALKAYSTRDGADVNMTEDSPDPDLTPTVALCLAMNKLIDAKIKPEGFRDDGTTMADFLTALPLIQPSSKREGFATVPDTTWASIGALETVKQQLQRAIVRPIADPAIYAHFHRATPAGVLLWGPPGCGKTLLAKAVANESRANFISVKGPELLNKYVGESERAVRQVFFRARSSAPCVVFFDELDAVVPARAHDAGSDASARVVNTLLTELDGVGARAGIYIIAATNRPDVIDPAMLRPGRLGKLLFVGLPGPEERVEILRTLLRDVPAESGLEEFARRAEGFSGADLSSLIDEGVQQTIERGGRELAAADFEHALTVVKPSVTNMQMYERMKGKLSSKV